MTRSTILALLLFGSACAERHDYQYFRLQEDFTVTETGQATASGWSSDAVIPTAYRLERDEYDLIARIDAESLWPAVEFRILARPIAGLRVSGMVQSDCQGSFSNFSNDGYRFDPVPAETLRFLRLPVEPGSRCAAERRNDEGPISVRLDIIDGDGRVFAVEPISLFLASAGMIKTYDGL